MTKACPIPTPSERRFAEIQDPIIRDMLRKIYAALQDATDQARDEVTAAGLAMQPPAYKYLAAIAHQHLYCTLCDADPETFDGGNAESAISLIRNSQNVARRYWGATIEPLSKP